MEVIMGFIQSFDNSILYYIYEHWHNAFTNGFFTAISSASNGGIIWIVLGIIMLFSKKWRPTGIILLLSVGLSAVIGNLILKNIFCRIRPFVADPSIELIIGVPHGYYSFPSGISCGTLSHGRALRSDIGRGMLGAAVYFRAAATGKAYGSQGSKAITISMIPHIHCKFMLPV